MQYPHLAGLPSHVIPQTLLTSMSKSCQVSGFDRPTIGDWREAKTSNLAATKWIRIAYSGTRVDMSRKHALKVAFSFKKKPH
jgi:hypothetical protein